METCLERVQNLVRQSGVSFQTQRHRERAVESRDKGAQVAKVIIAEADGDLVMLVLATPARVNYTKVRAALAVHHAIPAPEYLFRDRFADCLPGAMPPFGKLYDMRTLIDSELAKIDTITFQVGTLHDRLKMATADYLTLAEPEVVAFAFAPSFGF